MMTQMDNICLVPQKSPFEIQDFTYVYTGDSTIVVKGRSFQPLERYNNYYCLLYTSPAPSKEEVLLTEIRDLLKEQTDKK